MGYYSSEQVKVQARNLIFGKVLSAFLTFISFSLIARAIGVKDFGVYAVLFSTLEIVISLATFGLDWICGRYLPEYRLKASRNAFGRFVWGCLGLYTLSLLIFAVIIYYSSEKVSSYLNISAVYLELYSIVIFIEGCSRFIRDQLLGLLLAQKYAQLSIVSRSVVIFVGAVLLNLPKFNEFGLYFILYFELGASLCSLLISGFFLYKLTTNHKTDTSIINYQSFSPPEIKNLAVLSSKAYLSMLLLVPSSGSFITLILGSLTSSYEAGLFGFCKTFLDQVKRFLPVEFFLSIIRPKFVAQYVKNRSFAELSDNSALLILISFFLLMPFISVSAAYPEVFSVIIGGEGFIDSAPYLSIWCLTLLTFSYRRVLEIICNTVEKPSICLWAGVNFLFTIILFVVLLSSGVSVIYSLIAPILGDILFSATVVLMLRRYDLHYTVFSHGFCIYVITQIASIVCVYCSGYLIDFNDEIYQACFACLIAVLTSWGFVFLAKPLLKEELFKVRSFILK